MDSSIQRSASPPIFDQLSSNLDTSPVTSTDSTPLDAVPVDKATLPTSSASQVPCSILKSSSSGHTVTTVASEITPFKTRKNVSLAPTAQAVSQEGEVSTHNVKWIPAKEPIQKTITKDPTPSSEEDNLKLNKFTLRLSEQIKKWASDTFTTRKQELSEATALLETFLQQNPRADKEIVAQLKGKLALIKDQSAKAGQYAQWTSARDSLFHEKFRGGKERANQLVEKGFSVGSDWSSGELQEDWKEESEQPWAKTSPAREEMEKIISAYRPTEDAKDTVLAPEPPESKSEQKQNALHQRTDDSSAYESPEDIVSVPGVGNVDRNKYDIGNAEHNEDGTYTVIDMTGRRYDYPPRKPPSDSCIVS